MTNNVSMIALAYYRWRVTFKISSEQSNLKIYILKPSWRIY